LHSDSIVNKSTRNQEEISTHLQDGSITGKLNESVTVGHPGEDNHKMAALLREKLHRSKQKLGVHESRTEGDPVEEADRSVVEADHIRLAVHAVQRRHSSSSKVEQDEGISIREMYAIEKASKGYSSSLQLKLLKGTEYEDDDDVSMLHNSIDTVESQKKSSKRARKSSDIPGTVATEIRNAAGSAASTSGAVGGKLIIQCIRCIGSASYRSAESNTPFMSLGEYSELRLKTRE